MFTVKVWYTRNVRGHLRFRAGKSPSRRWDDHWSLAGEVRVSDHPEGYYGMASYQPVISMFPPPEPPRSFLVGVFDWAERKAVELRMV